MMIMTIAQPNSPGEAGWNHGDFITVVIAQYSDAVYLIPTSSFWML